MPVELTTFELPGGTRCLRVVTSGHFSKDDADVLVRQTSTGGPYVGLPRLVLTQRQESISSDARGLLAAGRNHPEQEPWAAVVVTNPIVRVASNFLTRVIRTSHVRLFGTEAEAIQWLTERTREDQARTGPGAA